MANVSKAERNANAQALLFKQLLDLNMITPEQVAAAVLNGGTVPATPATETADLADSGKAPSGPANASDAELAPSATPAAATRPVASQAAWLAGLAPFDNTKREVQVDDGKDADTGKAKTRKATRHLRDETREAIMPLCEAQHPVIRFEQLDLQGKGTGRYLTLQLAKSKGGSIQYLVNQPKVFVTVKDAKGVEGGITLKATGIYFQAQEFARQGG